MSAAAQRAAAGAQEAAQQQAAASQRQERKGRAGALLRRFPRRSPVSWPRPRRSRECREAMIAHLERVAAESPISRIIRDHPLIRPVIGLSSRGS